MWNFSALLRPVRFLSLGARSMDIASGDSFFLYGAGLRPFFFSPYWISRLTLFADMKYDSDNEFVTCGARGEILDGINIYYEYSFDKELFETGISLSLSSLTAGVKSVSGKNILNPEKYKGFAYIPAKRERTIIPPPVSYIAEYDMGNIIKDSPYQGGFSDLIPALKRRYPQSIYNFLCDMQNIAETDEIKAVIFKNQYFLTSYANITEISEALKMLKNEK